jgi:hypothetical protein
MNSQPQNDTVLVKFMLVLISLPIFFVIPQILLSFLNIYKKIRTDILAIKRKLGKTSNQVAILKLNCTTIYPKLERKYKFKEKLNDYRMNLLKN